MSPIQIDFALIFHFLEWLKHTIIPLKNVGVTKCVFKAREHMGANFVERHE